jgi:cellulose synthase (UDP-forming)
MVNLNLWEWWFRKEHVVWNVFSITMFILVSLAFFYDTTFLPTVYLFFVGKMRKPPERRAPRAQSDVKVAMVTLCVPSKESFGVIERQLKAMVNVKYPHDSWVLDEEGDPRVRALAKRLGVKYFTRKGREEYNQSHPPFQAKTKAGNFNAWLDAHGRRYDFVTQLDIDHVPSPDYLNNVLGYFEDPRVAWVQGPSIYGNFDNWTARGAAEQELVLQGPLQMGFYGFNQTPYIIGSHTTYRVEALLQIGGFQPTRAEDHLDTVVLAAHGWKGVFIPEPIAVGDGPETLNIYLAQQFAWAYSLMQVLLCYFPKYIRNLSVRHVLQFLFSETWYPLYGMSMAILFLMPLCSLIFNVPIATMSFFGFLVHYLPVAVSCFGIWCWTRRWFQPKGLTLSWRGIVLHIARWPIIMWALINVLFGVKRPYMITPKGMPNKNQKLHPIYFILMTLPLASVIIFLMNPRADKRVSGYIFYALEGSCFFLLVYLTNILTAQKREISEWLRFGALVLAFVSTALWSSPLVVQAITWTPSPSISIESDRLTSLVPVSPSSYAPENQSSISTSTPISAPTPTPVSASTPTPISTNVFFLPPATVTPSMPQRTFISTSSKIMFGAYDPEGKLNGTKLNIHHEYISWCDSSDKLYKALASARKLGRIPMITIEPWPCGSQDENLLREIVSGMYDDRIRSLAREIRKFSEFQEVWVRWGHEMDLSGLYPWSGDPQQYIEAYRRVVHIFSEESPGVVKFIWSPAGGKAEKYWPGPEYVDYIGITILCDRRWEEQAGFNEPRSFEALLNEKYWLLKYGKPLIIAELGISCSPECKRNWLLEARAALSKFPGVKAVVYFNAVNAHAPGGYRPDWRIGWEFNLLFH